MRGPHTLTRALWALLTMLFLAPAALAQVAPPGNSVPAEFMVNDQKAGSVLFYNVYSSNPTGFNWDNTRINITNTSLTDSVAVHLFFVDGVTCTPADSFICLTPNGTVSFLASDMDPGVMGFIVAVAVDRNGVPIKFNYLIGDEMVKLISGHQANLTAEAFSALINNPAIMMDPGRALLLFNNGNYNMAPRVLAVDSIPSRLDGHNTLLIINRFGGDLLTGERWIGSIFGILYDDGEAGFSFTFSAKCQLKQILSSNFPRTVPVFSSAIQTGHTGWMRLWSTGAPDNATPGILGAVLYRGPDADPHSLCQGHNLHKLTLVSEGYFVPVFPPNC